MKRKISLEQRIDDFTDRYIEYLKKWLQDEVDAENYEEANNILNILDRLYKKIENKK